MRWPTVWVFAVMCRRWPGGVLTCPGNPRGMLFVSIVCSITGRCLVRPRKPQGLGIVAVRAMGIRSTIWQIVVCVTGS